MAVMVTTKNEGGVWNVLPANDRSWSIGRKNKFRIKVE